MPPSPVSNQFQRSYAASSERTSSIHEQPHEQPASRIETASSMLLPATQLRLSNINDHNISMPGLVEKLSRLIQHSQQDDTVRHPDLRHIELKEMQAEFQRIDQGISPYQTRFGFIDHQYRTAVTHFISSLSTQKPDRPEEIIMKTQNLLDGKSQFYSYIKNYDSLLTRADDYAILLGITNKLKETLHHLHLSPTEVLAEAFNHFPPRDADTDFELKCLEGVEDRMEISTDSIKQHLCRLGLRESQSLVQQLNPQAAEPLQRMTQTALQLCHDTGVDGFIMESMEAHRMKALFLSLGIPPDSYKHNNRFAAAVLNNAPANLLYDAQRLFAQKIQNSLAEDLSASTTHQRLHAFETLLASVTEKQLNNENLQERLAADGLTPDQALLYPNPQSYGLNLVQKQALSRLIMENTDESHHFADRFGEWNDEVTQLEDWKYADISQALNQGIAKEWSLNHPPSLLAKLTFDDIRKQVQAGYISSALFGKVNDNEQWYALNYLLALVKGNSAHTNLTGEQKFIAFHLLVNDSLVNAEPPPYTLTKYLHNRTDAYINAHPAMPMANINLMRRLNSKVTDIFNSQFPYNRTTITLLVHAFNAISTDKILTLRQLTYTLDMFTPPEILAQKFQSYYTQCKPAPAELELQISPIITALVEHHDERIPAFLNHIFKNHPDILNSLLSNILYKQLSRALIDSPGKMKILLEEKSTILFWFPKLIASDQLHTRFPKMAYYISAYSITSGQDKYMGQLISSDTALYNLKMMPMSAEHSLVTLHQKSSENMNGMFRSMLIRIVEWPAQHYLCSRGSVADSVYFKALKNTLSVEGFKQAYETITLDRPESIHQIINEFILPIYRQASNGQELDYFNKICLTLTPEDQSLLGQYRGQFIDHACSAPEIWQASLFTAAINALPANAVASMADVVFLLGQTVQQRSDFNSPINQKLRASGVNPESLMRSYPAVDRNYWHSSQFLFALTTPPNQSGLNALVARLIQNDSKEFFNSITDATFGQICRHHLIDPAARFRELYSFLPDHLKLQLKNDLMVLPAELRNKIAQDILSCISNLY